MAIAGIKFDLYILNAGSFILLADLRYTFSIVPDRIVSTGNEKQWEIFRNLLNMSRILYVLDAAEHLVIAVDRKTEGGPWMMNAGVDDSLIFGQPVTWCACRFKLFVVAAKRHVVHKSTAVCPATEQCDRATDQFSYMQDDTRLGAGSHDDSA